VHSAVETPTDARRVRAYRALIGIAAAAASIVLILAFNPLVGEVIDPTPDPLPSGEALPPPPSPPGPEEPRLPFPPETPAPGIAAKDPALPLRAHRDRPEVAKPTDPDPDPNPDPNPDPDPGPDCGVGFTKPRCTSAPIGIEFSKPKALGDQIH
jgi:hypothetical protein